MVSRNDIFLGTTYAETLREIGVLKTSKKSKILVLNNEKNMYMRMCIHSGTCAYIAEVGSTGWGLACPFWKLKKCPNFRKIPWSSLNISKDFGQCTAKNRVMSDEASSKRTQLSGAKLKAIFICFRRVKTQKHSVSVGLYCFVFYEHFNR